MSREPDASARLCAGLIRGEHIVVHGPRGIGKTALLEAARSALDREAIPCGIAHATSSLGDITAALARAYVRVEVAGIAQRRVRGRLLQAAETSRAVLLLDHVVAVTSAMKGFLRSLRGSCVGVALAVDVDVPRERARIRRWCVSHHEFEVPPLQPGALRRLLSAELHRRSLPAIDVSEATALAREARGRPGFIVRCCELARDRSYWREGKIRVPALSWEAELALRVGDIPFEQVSTLHSSRTH
jgi:hypothetical protein